VHTDTASTSRLGAVKRFGVLNIAAPLAIVTGLLSAPAFADTYRYSPENPYPPQDRAATEYMKQGYMSGEGDGTQHWAHSSGKPDVPKAYDPFWMFAPLRSLGTAFGIGGPATR
jgi:hypothetical protein